MKITIRDVAQAASVSVATASLALNNRKGVNEQTRQHVLQVAEQLNYIPNQSARSLVTNSSNYIGLIVPEIVNPFYSEIVDLVSRLVEQKGYTVLLGISNSKQRLEKEYLQMFLSHNVQGVILVPMLSRDPRTEHLQLLRDARIPFVFCTDRYADCTEPCAMCDFEQGEYDLIGYLLDKGLRRIFFLSADINAHFAKNRRAGFLKAYQSRGLEVGHNQIFLLGTPTFDDAYQAFDGLLQHHPEAVASINDMMAMAVMKRLWELGIQVPEDISVAGFDNMMFAPLALKPITTVQHPLTEICGKCVELLEALIRHRRGGPEPEDGIHLYKAKLIIRDTTV